ncbi:hypothetical protein M8C21_033756, partial [Ambrosia artemisiifolia]
GFRLIKLIFDLNHVCFWMVLKVLNPWKILEPTVRNNICIHTQPATLSSIASAIPQRCGWEQWLQAFPHALVIDE